MAGNFVFVTGGTGFIGRRAIALLKSRGHKIAAVAREGSQGKLPEGCEIIVADALDRNTWQRHLKPFHTMVHLVGAPNRARAKAIEFIDIDLRSTREAIRAAQNARVRQFVYVSAAQPAPAMESYLMVREACETAIREAGLKATILRPWYVTGPERSWPLALTPLYALAGMVPGLGDVARRLGLVSVDQVAKAIAYAVENPPAGVVVVDVPAIRAIARSIG